MVFGLNVPNLSGKLGRNVDHLKLLCIALLDSIVPLFLSVSFPPLRLQHLLGRASFLHGGVAQIRNNRQASGMSLQSHLDFRLLQPLHMNCTSRSVDCGGSRTLNLVLLQTYTATVLSIL